MEETFKQFDFTNNEDAVKVALALFIETVMVRKYKKTLLDMDMFGRDDDQEVYKNYD